VKAVIDEHDRRIIERIAPGSGRMASSSSEST